jgi:hypothetical protein
MLLDELAGKVAPVWLLLDCVWHANDSFIVEPAEKCADHLKSIAQRLGLPIPPLTDKEQPPRSGGGHQTSALGVMQLSAARFEP